LNGTIGFLLNVLTLQICLLMQNRAKTTPGYLTARAFWAELEVVGGKTPNTNIMQRQIKTLVAFAILGGGAALGLAGCSNMHGSIHRDPGEPRIVCQPADVLAKDGSPIDLTVRAHGKSQLYYEWFYQANDFAAPVPVEDLREKIEGADSNVLHIFYSRTNDTGVYTCRVSREDPRKGVLKTQTVPAYVTVFPRFASSVFPPPGFGSIKAGNKPPALCSDVPKFVASACIVACPLTSTVLWQPIPGATTATVSIQDPLTYPDAWIAYKLIGAPTPHPCAGKGSITFHIPTGSPLIMFTVYFTKPQSSSGVSIMWNPGEIQPSCP
jgi:hypothetical protein